MMSDDNCMNCQWSPAGVELSLAEAVILPQGLGLQELVQLGLEGRLRDELEGVQEILQDS